MKLVYPAIFYPYESGDGYVVEFPDLPGCITQGESIEEAFEMAADAASGWIFTSIEEGEDLPKPSSDLKISDFEDAVLINYILLDMDYLIVLLNIKNYLLRKKKKEHLRNLI